MNGQIHFNIYVIIFALVVSILGCALFREFKPDNFTSRCTHCHGEKLNGVNNTKGVCGQCHDISVPLSSKNISDPGIKEAISSEPHIHNTKNIYSGTPSCFYCHRNGSF